MADNLARLHIQVCYAKPDRQILRDFMVPRGTTLRDAIMQSGILQEAPEIDLNAWRVGIYGMLKSPDTVLREHDRVEIYRPLLADPKDARRRRAARKEAAKGRRT